MKDSYLTVKNTASAEIEIKKSRFICNIKEVDNEEDAKSFIKDIKAKYSDARHVCYAYICGASGNNFKYSDGGEPQGTAGVPMLEALKNKNLTNVVATVTRYFGGILLGAGGLVRAYGDSVLEGVKVAKIKEYCRSAKMTTTLSYTLQPKFLNLLSNYKSKVLNVEYLNDGVKSTFVVECNSEEKIINLVSEISSGKSVALKVEDCYFGY